MNERDLENLKHAPVPPARDESRRAALDAALAAFDEGQDGEANLSDAAQGTGEVVRLRKTSKSNRSFPMNLTSRQNMAIAASLAAIAIVAPFAFQQLRKSDFPGLEAVRVDDAPAKEKAQELQRAKTIDIARTEAARQSESEKKATVASLANKPDQATSPPEPAKPAAPAAVPEPVPGLALDSSQSANGAGGQLSAVPPPAASPHVGFAGPQLSARHAKQRSALKAAPFPSVAPGQTRNMLGAQSSEPLAAIYGGRAQDKLQLKDEEEHRDRFTSTPVNPIKQIATEPVSTFSIDVDTASYSFVRRMLNSGHLPPKDAVRVEELINYFPYDYPAPDTKETPFKPIITVTPSPWKPTNKLVHIAIKGYDLKQAERPRSNLVFLLDVSGSMEPSDRLPLVKNAMRMLLDQLRPDDTVGIVTYASGSGIALEPTKASDKQKILAAIDKLDAGGSTAGAAGIEDAYRLAEAGFDKSAVNRIVLATDGDFNVGLTDDDQLESYIEKKRKTGIFLSILGVGIGNHNDALMQKLAQNGNGTAAYVDTLNEARKVLVDEASSTLFTIAKDVKIQVEWNPARVAEYRLIGYETRALQREDFNNDSVDAGDVGSGHAVTAIYEVTPVGAPRVVDDLRYAKQATPAPATEAAAKSDGNDEFGFLKIRYKKPNEDTSQLISQPISEQLGKASIADASQDVRFSVAVAAFGDLVRQAPYVGAYTYDDVIKLGQSARGDDPFGYRAEFLNLARLAKSARP